MEKKIVELLEKVKGRTALYFWPIAPEMAVSFLNGFYLCFQNLTEGNHEFNEYKQKVLYSRGWQVPSIVLRIQMEEKGFTAEQMVNEIFTIEIEAWKLFEQEKL